MAIKISGSTIINDSRVIVNADKIGIGTPSPTRELSILSPNPNPTGIGVSAATSQGTDVNKAISIFNAGITSTFSVSYTGRVDADEYYGTFKGTIGSGVAIENANKVSMSLSDQFCVDRHKPHFLDLVKNRLDMTFANEGEIMSLIETKNFNDVINFAKEIRKNLIITRGENGAVSIVNNEVTEVGIKKNLKILDLTGAGDLFAAGYLHGYLGNLSQLECLEKGTEMSAKIIQQIGARI